MEIHSYMCKSAISVSTCRSIKNVTNLKLILRYKWRKSVSLFNYRLQGKNFKQSTKFIHYKPFVTLKQTERLLAAVWFFYLKGCHVLCWKYLKTRHNFRLDLSSFQLWHWAHWKWVYDIYPSRSLQGDQLVVGELEVNWQDKGKPTIHSLLNTNVPNYNGKNFSSEFGRYKKRQSDFENKCISSIPL